jgi:Cytochrome c7 and related cytochrome c
LTRFAQDTGRLCAVLFGAFGFDGGWAAKREGPMTKHTLLRGIIALTLLLFASPALAQQGATKFDHFKTGFPLTGAHAFVECVSCHINGRLQGTPRSCAACHNGSLAPGRPDNHIPTWVPTCETCHRSTVAFGPNTRMNHSGIISGCTACHNGQGFFGVTPVSKTPNHLVTTADCIDCHRSFVSFAGATGGMPANHIPTTQPCTLCHTGSTLGPNTPMNHTGISSGCATCHGGQAFYGVTPVSKGTTHIATTGDCSTCHTSTTVPGGFAAYNKPMDHSTVTGTCTSCHTGQTFQNVTPVSSASNHIPTTQDCGTCHKSTSAFSGTVMVHTGITSNCAQCHSGTAYQGVTPMAKGSTHIAATGDCSTCHTSTTVPGGFAAYTMSHSTVTGTCASCHTGQTFQNVTPVSSASNHIPTTQDCGTCHKSTTVFSGTTMVHTGITSNCAQCHSGTAFQGVTPMTKNTGHIATTADCSTCHTNTTVPGGFATATGGTMPANHIPTTQPCTLCHTSGTFSPGTPMNHSGITSGCATCHGGQAFYGVTPVSKGTNHVPTTADCVTCHTSFTSFAGAIFSHAGITSGCATCHNGTAFQNVTPVSKPSNHITTTQDCSICHKSTTAFGPGTAMNHTGISSGCATCHGGQAFYGVTPVSKGANHVPTTADCVTCHASFTSFAGATFSHAGITSGCATCHNGTAFQNVTPVSKPSTHLTTAQDCSICHKSTTAFGPGTAMNHTGITSGCATCHTGQAFYGVTPVAKPAAHVPIPAGTDCSSCHTSFVSFAGATFNHAGVSSGTCNSCHNGTYPGVMSQSSVTGHVPTGVVPCDTCHTSKVVGGFATFTMGNAGHAALGVQLSTSSCMTCHAGNYFGVAKFNSHGKPLCGTCHCKCFTQIP